MPNYKRKPKTKLPALTEDGLPVLTPKQNRFVQEFLVTGNATEAYRRAYEPSDPKADWIRIDAYQVRSDPHVALTIRKFQRDGLDTAKVTLESHLAELARLRETAVEVGQVSAGVQAEHYRGKASGLYEDKLRINIGLDDSAILGQLSSLLGAELAQVIDGQLEDNCVANTVPLLTDNKND